MVRLTRRKIAPARLLDSMRAPEAGAVVTFYGMVRNRSRNRRVRGLQYEAYREMALKQLREIERDVRRRFGAREVAIVHRIGTLEVGEISVGIAVAAVHRNEAFRGCRYTIDRLKKAVAIWKKEIYDRGAAWIGKGGG